VGDSGGAAGAKGDGDTPGDGVTEDGGGGTGMPETPYLFRHPNGIGYPPIPRELARHTWNSFRAYFLGKRQPTDGCRLARKVGLRRSLPRVPFLLRLLDHSH
jgi:hypothetical protein